MPERASLADSDAILGALRGHAAATQGLPQVRQDRGRAGLHPHAALFPNPDGRGPRPLEESPVLRADPGARGRDALVQRISGIYGRSSRSATCG